MAKIGRNDICTCGSGKKYKYCCLNGKSKAFGTATPSRKMEIPIYPEEEVLGNLIENSEIFRNYYTFEKDYFGNINWVKSNEAVEAKFGFIKGQKGKMSITKGKQGFTKYIILEQIPPELSDEYIIAHEMGHILILNKGFPGISPILTNNLSDEERFWRIRLAASMTNIIHDPLCDSLVKSYGFSLEGLYSSSTMGFMKNVSDMEEPDMNTYSGYDMIFRHVLRILQGTITTPDAITLKKYNDFFEKKFPHIAEEAQFILDLIEIHGYDTPEKARLFYQELLNSMELRAVCKLETIC